MSPSYQCVLTAQVSSQLKRFSSRCSSHSRRGISAISQKEQLGHTAGDIKPPRTATFLCHSPDVVPVLVSLGSREWAAEDLAPVTLRLQSPSLGDVRAPDILIKASGPTETSVFTATCMKVPRLCAKLTVIQFAKEFDFYQTSSFLNHATSFPIKHPFSHEVHSL